VPPFAYRSLWNVETYSGFMPANLTTLAHFSVSSAISFPKSAGEPAIAKPPGSVFGMLAGRWH